MKMLAWALSVIAALTAMSCIVATYWAIWAAGPLSGRLANTAYASLMLTIFIGMAAVFAWIEVREK